MFSKEKKKKSYGFSLDEITNFDERSKTETFYNGVGYNEELATAIKSILPVKTANVFYKRRSELALKKKANIQSKLATAQSKLADVKSKSIITPSKSLITPSKSISTLSKSILTQSKPAIAQSKSTIMHSKLTHEEVKQNVVEPNKQLSKKSSKRPISEDTQVIYPPIKYRRAVQPFATSVAKSTTSGFTRIHDSKGTIIMIPKYKQIAGTPTRYSSILDKSKIVKGTVVNIRDILTK